MSENRAPCPACAAREPLTILRNNFMGDVDPTLGLLPAGGELFECPACGIRYRRSVETATPFHDYDEYYFTRLDLPRPAVREKVLRCPECGSRGAYADESRSRLEFTHLQCDDCGYGGLFDSWQRDLDWTGEADVPAGGCCSAGDAADAWASIQSQRVGSPVKEIHFGIDLTCCSCGGRFATVFTERNDHQTWLVVRLSAAEQDRLAACGDVEAPRVLAELGRARRFLLRSYSPDVGWTLGWREGGFSIGPHD